MAKFAYNNAKNTTTGYTFFKLNCAYYPYIFYKENINFYSQFKIVDKLSVGL